MSDILNRPQKSMGFPAKTTTARSPPNVVSSDTETSSTTSIVVPVSPSPTIERVDTSSARRALSNDEKKNDVEHDSINPVTHPPAKRRLVFGRHEVTAATHVPSNVKQVYKAIQKQTGSIGGNGSFGAIYGELTVGSMQRMVDLMKQHTGLSTDSKFIDVGSGLGKPNLHVAQDPGVMFSYGIEMERVRWMLGMSNLKQVLKLAEKQQHRDDSKKSIGYNCYFSHGNILDAKTFDPFTHVYMFSIGFPPDLWLGLSEMFNRSSASKYLICYHSPKDIIERYGFRVELVTQTPTSMHASGEGHMGYIYRRLDHKQLKKETCDALFREAYDIVRKSDLNHIVEHVNAQVHQQYRCGRHTRSSGLVMSAVPTTPTKRKKRKLSN